VSRFAVAQQSEGRCRTPVVRTSALPDRLVRPATGLTSGRDVFSQRTRSEPDHGGLIAAKDRDATRLVNAGETAPSERVTTVKHEVNTRPPWEPSGCRRLGGWRFASCGLGAGSPSRSLMPHSSCHHVGSRAAVSLDKSGRIKRPGLRRVRPWGRHSLSGGAGGQGLAWGACPDFVAGVKSGHGWPCVWVMSRISGCWWTGFVLRSRPRDHQAADRLAEGRHSNLVGSVSAAGLAEADSARRLLPRGWRSRALYGRRLDGCAGDRRSIRAAVVRPSSNGKGPEPTWKGGLGMGAGAPRRRGWRSGEWPAWRTPARGVGPGDHRRPRVRA